MSEEKEEVAEGHEGEEGGKKKGGKKKLLLILVPLLLLIGGGAAAYFTGMLDSLLGKEAATEEGAEGDKAEAGDKKEGGHEKAADSHGKEAKAGGEGHGEAAGGHGGEGGDGAFLPLPTMLVNLNSDDGTPNYLRLTVQLELEDPADREAVEAVIPRVVDQFQTYLRELRVKDLRGSAGIYRLQMELLWRVNQAASPIEIKDVLFQEILIN